MTSPSLGAVVGRRGAPWGEGYRNWRGPVPLRHCVGRAVQQSRYRNWSLHEQEIRFTVHYAKPPRSWGCLFQQPRWIVLTTSPSLHPLAYTQENKWWRGARSGKASSGGSSCKARTPRLKEKSVSRFFCLLSRKEKGLSSNSVLRFLLMD